MAKKKAGDRRRKPFFTEAAIANALRQTGGNMAAAARLLTRETGHEISRWAIHLRVKNSEELQRLITEFRETMVDAAESGLQKLVMERVPSAIYYVLDRLGKNRGYTRTVTVRGDGEGPALKVQMEAMRDRYESLSDEELKERLRTVAYTIEKLQIPDDEEEA